MRLIIDKATLGGPVGENSWKTAASGQVRGLEWDPPYLAANVKNEEGEARRVRVQLRQEGEAFLLDHAACSCASQGKDWCSHAVGAMLAATDPTRSPSNNPDGYQQIHNALHDGLELPPYIEDIAGKVRI